MPLFEAKCVRVRIKLTHEGKETVVEKKRERRSWCVPGPDGVRFTYCEAMQTLRRF